MVAGIGVGAASSSHRQVDIAAVDDHAAVGVDALAARCGAAHGDGQVGAAVDKDAAVALQARAVRGVVVGDHCCAGAVDGDGTAVETDALSGLDALALPTRKRHVDGAARHGEGAVAGDALTVGLGHVDGDGAAADLHKAAVAVDAGLGVVNLYAAGVHLEIVAVQTIGNRIVDLDVAAENADIVVAEDAVFDVAVDVEGAVTGEFDLSLAVESCLVGGGIAAVHERAGAFQMGGNLHVFNDLDGRAGGVGDAHAVHDQVDTAVGLHEQRAVAGGAGEVVDDVGGARGSHDRHIGAIGGDRHATVRPRVDDAGTVAVVGDVNDITRIHLHLFIRKDNTVDTNNRELEIGLSNVVMDDGNVIHKTYAVDILNQLRMNGSGSIIKNDALLCRKSPGG